MRSLPFFKKNLGAPLQSRKAMLETLFRHLDMVRLSAGAILMIAMVGCTGLINGGSDGLTDQQRDAKTRWEEDAYPVLSTNCASCHNGSRVGVGFLVGASSDDVKKSLLAYQPAVINFDAPGSSRILSKGLHDGPELTASQASSLLEWLQAEKEAEDHDPDKPVQVFAVTQFTPMICVSGDPDNAGGTCPTNHISLGTIDTIGPMLPGAEISFTAQALTSLYITNLKLVPGTSGLYLEHPLFVSRPAMADPFPDQIDRFFAIKENLAGGAMPDSLGGGTASFNGFVPTDPLEIHFKIVSAYKPATGGTTDPGTCKKLDLFTANASPQLQTNCFSCHGGSNANATAAMDLSKLSTDAAGTCAQVKSRINLTTTDQSAFYIAPDPTPPLSNHQFHFGTAAAFTAFKTPVDLWVQAEKTAP